MTHTVRLTNGFNAGVVLLDGEVAVKLVPLPPSSYGIRKTKPTEAEQQEINAVDSSRMAVFNRIIDEWKAGDVLQRTKNEFDTFFPDPVFAKKEAQPALEA